MSSCAQDAIFATVQILPEVAAPIAKKYLQDSLGASLSAKGLEQINRVEAVGITVAEVAKGITKNAGKKEKFISGNRTAVTDPNTVMGLRYVGLEDMVTHHSLASAYARIIGAVTAKYGDKIKTGKTALDDLISRISAGEAAVRASGIPIVINKAMIQPGPMHYSFLAIGDIGRVFAKTENKEILAAALFNSRTGTKNIQFQNLAEAARRVVEDSGKVTKEKLVDSVRSALTESIGKPIDTKNAKLLEEALAWTKTAEGTKVVDNLVATMIDPKFVKELVKADTNLAAVTIALAKADGYQLAAKTLESVADLSHLGEKLKGYGNLLLKNGIIELFGKDALTKLNPEQLNLAFAQNAIALFFSHLGDESIAAITASTRKARGAAKDAAAKAKGKQTKTGLNSANASVAKDERAAVTKIVEHEMANDPIIRNMESSEEASSIARQFYLELHHGTVVSGLMKLVSKVSNIATMGSLMKTQLIGAEHLRLENSAIVTATLRKFADKHGQDIPRFNEIFRALQETTDATRAAVIAGLKTEDQQLATEMVYFIDHIYGIGEFNKLLQEGIHTDEMVNSLRLVGQGKQSDLFIAKGITNAEEAKDFWKEIDLGESDNIVEILAKYHAAIQLSMIKPKLAEQVRTYFSHEADGLTREEALRQGYKPIAAENGLSQFLALGEKPPLFHPEIVGKLQALNHYLEYTRGFNGDNIQKWVNRLDPIVSVLKSSNTIWRPGHHVTSALGNAFSNTLAGVWDPRHYAMAAKVMKQYKMIDDLDEGALSEILKTNIPEGYVFQGMPDGVKIALKDPKTGKTTTYSLDYDGIGKGATAVAGVRITPRRAKDVVENELQQGTVTNALMKNPASQGIAYADHQLARASAARDNIFRYALFIKELEKSGPYASLEEAFQKAGAKVHEFHPTVGTLTAEERKYARRIFYFYTWQKQAFFKILDLMANSPAIITIPSKLQYAIAESAGLNPESFGQPFDPTQLFAAYNTNTVYGPQLNTDQGPAGIKPAITQLDVIDSYLSQFQTTPGATLWENIGNNINPLNTQQGVGAIFGKNASPLFKIPAELATGNKIGDLGKITDIPQYLLDQTGASAISRITGQTPWGQRSDIKTGAFAEANKERQLINYWLGSKYTFYQSPSALDTARQERIEYFKRINHNGN